MDDETKNEGEIGSVKPESPSASDRIGEDVSSHPAQSEPDVNEKKKDLKAIVIVVVAVIGLGIVFWVSRDKELIDIVDDNEPATTVNPVSTNDKAQPYFTGINPAGIDFVNSHSDIGYARKSVRGTNWTLIVRDLNDPSQSVPIYKTGKERTSYVGRLSDTQPILKQDHAIKAFNLVDQSEQELIKVEDDRRIHHAKLSLDKKTIAYSVVVGDYPSPYDNTRNDAEIWVWDVETGEERKVLDTGVTIYNGLGVYGWSVDGRYMFGSNLAGDAGLIGGDMYRFDVMDNYSYEKIGREIDDSEMYMSFLMGSESPSGKKYAFTHCEEGFMASTCEGGREIFVYDIENGVTQSIYRHLDAQPNADEYLQNTVKSLVWINDSTLAFIADKSVKTISVLDRNEMRVISEYGVMTEKSIPTKLIVVGGHALVIEGDDLVEAYDFEKESFIDFSELTDELSKMDLFERL